MAGKAAKSPKVATLGEAMAQLEAKGDPKVRARNAKHGGGDNQFGVQLGEIRKIAKNLKGAGPGLTAALWDTGNMDARLLAVLLIDPNTLPAEELDRMVRSARAMQLAEWLASNIIRSHPGKETLRRRWMEDADPWAARAGWNLTAERVAKAPEGLDIPGLLDRIEAEMGQADPAAQWTMNMCLATIGIHFAAHRARAIAIGERLGVLRDYPCSKGCTSPYAPIWIAEMVRRGAAANTP